ncbi:MAG: gamma-glutamylcyclotransferase [Ignavibacterium sp.]|nr:gamma-glutamylcyclotransferase [Ignavibacterium sp.]
MKNNDLVIQYPVFVYGTLSEGMLNHSFLQGKYTKKEKALVCGLKVYPNKSNSYPFVIYHKPESVVQGELYYIKPEFYKEVMKNLDYLEGYNEDNPQYSHYLRELVTVYTKNGISELAYIYVANLIVCHDTINFHVDIKNGDWVKYKKQKEAEKLINKSEYTSIYDEFDIENYDKIYKINDTNYRIFPYQISELDDSFFLNYEISEIFEYLIPITNHVPFVNEGKVYAIEKMNYKNGDFYFFVVDEEGTQNYLFDTECLLLVKEDVLYELLDQIEELMEENI